jgi:hypothetical protein
LGVFAFAITRVIEYRRGRPRAAKRLVVTQIDPAARGVGFALGKNRNRRIVRMQPLSCHDMSFDPASKRIENSADRSDAVGHRRQRDRHAFQRVALGLPVQRLASRAGEFHPHALPEPYVSLSAHTAPSVRPAACRSCQWANRPGDVRITRASQSRAPFDLCRSGLNLRRAHLARKASIRRSVGYSADL